MNEVKKSLDHLAGDTSRDIEELKQRVLYGERHPKRRNPFPLVATAIVLAAVLFFTFTVYDGEQNNTTQQVYEVNEIVYDHLLTTETGGRQSITPEELEELRYRTLQQILLFDSLTDYAKQNGYVEDTEAIEKHIAEAEQSSELSPEEEQKQQETFGVTMEDYIQHVYRWSYQQQLASTWIETHELNDSKTIRDVLTAFMEKNDEVISEFMTKKSILYLPHSMDFAVFEGIVAYLDQQKVLLVHGVEPSQIKGKSPDDIIDAAYDYAWFALDDSTEDMTLYTQMEVTFDPLSSPVKDADRRMMYEEIVEWVEL